MSLQRISLAVFVSCSASGAIAQTVGNPTGMPKWDSHIEFELKPGNKRSVGESELFVTLAQDERSLVFANLRGRFDNRSDVEGNLGLGVRRMLTSGWNLGGYGYFDRRRTTQGSYFNQLTFGAEALGPDWDFRSNLYLPQGNRVSQLSSVTSTSGVTTASLSGASVQVVTSTTTSSTNLEEHALRGFDAEAGWRLPVFDLESRRQFRVYLGGYRFSDSQLTVSGSRGRVEFQLADLDGLWKGGQLTLSGQAQHDKARGGQTFIGIRLRIPLGGNGDSRPRLNAQERRMTASVVRDVDIVTQAQSNTVASTSQIVETATALSNGQSLTVLNSATTTGAALPGAVSAAGANSLVVLSGTFNTSAITTLQNGQTLMGAGTITVQTASGRTAMLTTPMATITGAVAGNNPAVLMGNNSTLTGLTVSNLSTGGGTPNPFAVRANGVSGATVSNNILTGTENLVGGTAQALLISGASSNITVSNNTLSATGTGIAVGLNVVNSTGILVTGNTMSAAGSSAGNSRAIVVNNGSFAAGSTGNTILSGICSVAVAGTGSIGLTSGATCP